MDALSFVSEPELTRIKSRIANRGMTLIVFHRDTRKAGPGWKWHGSPQVKIVTNQIGHPIRDRASAVRERQIFLDCLPAGNVFTVVSFWDGQNDGTRHIVTTQAAKPENNMPSNNGDTAFEDFSSDFFNIAPRTGSVGLNEYRSSSRFPKNASTALSGALPKRGAKKQKGKTNTKYDNYAEPADRSRHADGHMARENYGFGSMPLHDDYGDEATGE